MSNKNLAIYIHWPYCKSKCPYCDFNSHVAASVDHARWRSAYRAELEHLYRHFPEREITSVFFGGGTPSLMAPETTAMILSDIARLWGLSEAAEVTLEANPTSTEAEKFRAFREAGVNRVSIGVQSLNDADLKVLGREHSSGEALEAVAVARETFRRFSFDMIYTRAGQRVEKWVEELETALPHATGGHMSLYQLTIEPGTKYQTLYDSGRLIIPEDDEAAQFYDATARIMGAAGMPAYEISNYAVPGQESRHNLTYWRYEDYAGIGPGAHGRLSFTTADGPVEARATRAHKAPDIWLDSVLGSEGPQFWNAEPLSPQTRFEEMLMMGLRLRGGIDLSHVRQRTQILPEDAMDGRILEMLTEEGLITHDGRILAVTPRGMPVLDAILRALIA